MYDDELHEKASDYASNRKNAYLAQMQLGKVKKKSQDELNWIWVAHYEGYKEGHMSKDGITLNNIRHPRGKPALGDLNPESLETVEIDLPEPIGYVSEGAAERLTTVKQAHEQIRSFKLFTHDVPLYTAPPALAQPEQEPVALEEKFSLLLWDYQELERAFEKVTGGKWVRKSNTPQRAWVDLSDEEIETLIHRFDGDPHTLLDEVNARLKDKNT